MKAEGRSILLLIDNAGCYPENLKDKYSNIRMVFLPANTLSTVAAPVCQIDTACNETEVTSSSHGNQMGKSGMANSQFFYGTFYSTELA